MLNWIRKLPHPKYGKCGGYGRDCSLTPPRDWMDRAFEQHDKALSKCTTKHQCKQADHALARSLREGDPTALKLWGRIYRRLAMMIFKL